ncbi:MAG: L-seryl-tRNA(Sec) selenium transferase [Halioglobus sp.]
MTDQTTAASSHDYRQLPSIDALLQVMGDELDQWGHAPVTNALREATTALRADIASGKTPDMSLDAIRRTVNAKLTSQNRPSLTAVLNLSGTVLHTNLGRANLPEAAIEAVVKVASAPSNLEFDLETGKRGDRESHVEALVCEVTGAEAATAVNNNAAAVLLVLNTLAMHKEVPVSRGELVEIGGSFRIPEVMTRAGCTLVEVGATNRTHLYDFRDSICSDTALLMKVHTSNYRVEGFTSDVEEEELAALASEHHIPFVHDLGSGNLVNFSALGLPDEPTAAQALASGADLITFSGDKLLGGPQAGLIAGRADLIAQIKRNPLKRALRLDKMTLAALAEVLKLYRDPQTLSQHLPTLRLLTRTRTEIHKQAQALLPALSAAVKPHYEASVVDCVSQIGSGSLPVETLPSAALQIVATSGQDKDLRRLSDSLRKLPLPVVGRLHKGALWLDLRCLEANQQALFVEQLGTLLL